MVITVLPSMPLFRPRYTCAACGCQVVTSVPVGDGWASERVTLCSWCGVPYRDAAVIAQSCSPSNLGPLDEVLKAIEAVQREGS